MGVAGRYKNRRRALESPWSFESWRAGGLAGIGFIAILTIPVGELIDRATGVRLWQKVVCYSHRQHM